MKSKIQEIAYHTREACIARGENDAWIWEYKFAELIIEECVKRCKEVASDAKLMTSNKFLTDAGRLLHEGMWGGAMNCAASLDQLFADDEDADVA